MKKSQFLLGVDLGTSSVKCILLSPETNTRFCARGGYPTQTPQPGWTQQNPEDWLVAVEHTLKSLFERSGVSSQSVCGIGVCGAAHIGVLLDRNGDSCTPSLLWNDCRSVCEVEEIRACSQDWISEETLNYPGTAWTLSHLRWLKKHDRQAVNRAVTFLTSKDYIVRWLTGKNCMDYSSATATLMYNPRKKSWCENAMRLSPLARNAFPEVFPSDAVVGTTTHLAQARFGLPCDIPVIAGSLDSIAEFRAISGTSYNCELIRLGSAGGIMLLDDRIIPIPGMLVYPYPGGELYLKQAATTSCGQSIDWIRRMFRMESGPVPTEMMNMYATSVSPGCDGLIFHPYLQGERAPYERPDLRGSFTGLSLVHGKEHLIRAVLEGTAFSLRDGYCILHPKSTATQEVKVIGGGTGSSLWLDILAAVLNRPLQVVHNADSALGIALLTGEALNLPCRENSDEQRVEPNSDLVPLYENIFNEYRRIARFLLE